MAIHMQPTEEQIYFKSIYRFSKLSLNGLKLSKPAIDSLCQLAKTSSLSALMLGKTGIGTVSEFYFEKIVLC